MPRITDWTGIARTPYGYLVRVHVQPFPMRAKRFKFGTPLEEMQRWRSRQRSALERARPRAAQAGTVTADVQRYLEQWGTGKHPHTVTQRTRHLQLFAAVFGPRLRATLTTAEIEAQLRAWQRQGLPLSEFAHRRGRTRRPLTAETIRKVRQSIYQLFAVLDRGADVANPVTEIPVGTETDADPGGLPLAVVRAVLAALPRGKPKARCSVMAYVGLRPDEVQRMLPLDNDWRRRSLFVRTAKGGERVRVPVTRRGAAALRYFDQLQAYGPFTNAHPNRLLKEAATAAGYPELAITQYTLRHSFGTLHYATSQDLKATKEVMRHKSLRMTERYVRGAVSAVLEASVARLDQAVRRTRRSRPS